MLKWVVQLAPYRINYEPSNAIKAQTLAANFIVECLVPDEPKTKDDNSWIGYVYISATNDNGVGRDITQKAHIRT